MPDPLAALREVNKNLRQAMFSLRPERKHVSMLCPDDLVDLRKQISQAGGCLPLLPINEATEEMRGELLAYRRNLQELKQFLPDLHARLLAEQSRLRVARSHTAAAAHWAQADTSLFSYGK